MEAPRPPLKNCPFCKIAMVVVAADADLGGHDRFECLTCGTTITFNDGREWDATEDRPPEEN